MESFSRGWSFLKQAWQMAFKDKDLLKPSIYALIIGMIISVIGIIPIIGAVFLLGDSRIGNIVIFILGGIMVFVQFVISYIFSGMTVYLIYGYLAEGDGRMDKAWAVVRRDFVDILMLAAASTVVNLLRNAAQRNRGGIGASLARGATNLLQALWTEASYLILPAMVIDDLNLKDGMSRVLNITKQNLLLIGDWYTAKLYEIIQDELYLKDWKDNVRAKLDNLESIVETIQENFALSFEALMDRLQLIGWVLLLIGYLYLYILDAGWISFP